MARCEDAPCCGCGGECGTPLGGTPDYYYEDETREDFYDSDFYEDDVEEDEEEDDIPGTGEDDEDAFLDSYMEARLMGEE